MKYQQFANLRGGNVDGLDGGVGELEDGEAGHVDPGSASVLLGNL